MGSRKLLVILVVFAISTVACAVREEMSYAELAEDVYTDLFLLSEALDDGAEESEISGRLRILMEKMSLMVELAEDYDDLMARWRYLERRAMAVHGDMREPSPEGADAYFRDHGIDVDAKPNPVEGANLGGAAENADVRRLLNNHMASLAEMDDAIRNSRESDEGRTDEESE